MAKKKYVWKKPGIKKKWHYAGNYLKKTAKHARIFVLQPLVGKGPVYQYTSPRAALKEGWKKK